VAFFRVTTHIEAKPSRVWDLLADWEGSAEWMVDATTVEVLGEQRAGVGTRVRAVTTIAGVKLVDLLEVVGWEEERLMAVIHNGWPIRGLAWFEMRPTDSGTWFEWAEELDPPLGPLGELGGMVLRRPIERVLRKSLARLKRLAEAA
jgi:uncharacterized membrane protein